MEANDIILYSSIVIAIIVFLWAFILIRAFDKIDKD